MEKCGGFDEKRQTTLKSFLHNDRMSSAGASQTSHNANQTSVKSRSTLRKKLQAAKRADLRSARFTRSNSHTAGADQEERNGPRKISDTNRPHDASRIKRIRGNLFDCPPGSLLVHACNCQGTWGKGIASTFKRIYPAQFRKYHEHCLRSRNHAENLLGSSLLILPINDSSSRTGNDFVGCLFTRERPGYFQMKRNKDQDRVDILKNTESAFRHLLRQIEDLECQGTVIGQIVMPQINAGLFQVPWPATERVLAKVLGECGGARSVVVYTSG